MERGGYVVHRIDGAGVRVITWASMRVRLYGVSLKVAPALTLEGLFEHLRTLNESFKYRGLDRRIYVDSVGDYHVALFLTIRDHRITMELQEEDGRLVVKPKEIEEGKQAIDYNLLAVHKTTGRGVYQHYPYSLWLSTVGSILNRQHGEAVAARKGEWIAANGGPSRANHLTANKQYEGAFEMVQMVRPEDLETLISALDRVTAFTIDFEGIEDRQKRFQPFGNLVEATRHRIKFKAKLPGSRVARVITGFVKNEKPKAGKVEGYEDGLRRALDITESMPSTFGEFDFDTVAAEFVPDEFAKFSLLKRMIGTMVDNPSMFETPASS